MEETLKSVFGHQSFRQGQLEIINHIVEKKDLLALMPTGAGKSLCFQLPAISAKGVTVVISPLISLIYDQVQELKNLGVSAFFLNSTASAGQKAEAIGAVSAASCKLLYTTPETINSYEDLLMELDTLYENGLLEGFVIDEAHCVSNWGHDFRSSYLDLSKLRDYYPLIPIWAFTATATPKVQLDIVQQLKLEDYQIFKHSFIRKNLSYQIYERSGSVKSTFFRVAGLIKKSYNDQSGIVYCLRRADCEELASYLRQQGISADHYHAKLTIDRKNYVQNRWINGEIKVIVATIAFALGINKPDVRYVIHTAMPKSVESYYQETGRAGRDNQPSDCILFYSYQDKVILEKLSGGAAASASAPTTVKQRLNAMYDLCQNNYECVKMQLSNYLGEYITYKCSSDDNCCLNCQASTSASTSTSHVNMTGMALKIIESCRINGAQTRAKIIHSLRPEHSYYRLNRLIDHMLIGKYLKLAVFIKDGRVIEHIQLGPQKLAGELHVPTGITAGTATSLNSPWEDETVKQMLNNFTCRKFRSSN